MAEYKLTYESQLDAFHPSYRWEARDPNEDWKSTALRGPGLPVLGNAVAGAVGSAISNVVVYPLSVIVARLQTQNNQEKSKEESDDDEEYAGILDAGLAGFYPGIAQDTCKSVTDSFLFFLAYTIVRQRRIVARVGAAQAAKNKNIVLPILDELAVGVVAGAFSKLFTTPLSNIVTRKQTAAKKGKGSWWFLVGLFGFLDFDPQPFPHVLLNEVLKYSLLPRSKREKPSPAVTFFLAALSKSVASSITYPFSLAKTRAQAMGNAPKPTSSESKSLSAALTPKIFAAVSEIYRAEGVPGLYSGLRGEVLKGFFSHGFTMLAKDAVYASIVKTYYILLIMLRRYPSPDELLQSAREQAEEYSEVAREGARDMVERAREGTEDILNNHSGGVSADITANAAPAAHAAADAGHGVDASSGLKVPPITDEINETAELVGDYVEEEAAEWKTFYHWFWDKEKGYHKGE
ncbi:Mitochondrial substrate/solute carrier [Penicillium maclennaniae]|uniref:Mitochondrial substrate/solute carrier n=1 Tax=Penicillium maclennaniae TaxID=1343394 RepID=UPI00254166D6|nr:Mitochondrial substrate/solute carrier [Penicillium maclennaniae]KAJ5665836.1 Mitochondrial substrate/solute carrier [Penicillium maclennaniae]